MQPADPLSSLEIEETLLGLLLIAPQEIPKIVNLLSIDDFAHPKSQAVFTLIFKLLNLRFKDPDILNTFKDNSFESKFIYQNIYKTIADDSRFKILNNAYIDYLIVNSGLATNIYDYAHALRDFTRKRQLAAILESAKKLLTTTESPSSTKIAESLANNIAQIESQVDETSYENIQAVAERVHTSLIKRSTTKGAYNLRSGYPELDRITEGFDKGDLIIIAARPSMGKTAFAMNIAANCAKRDHNRVLFYSLEMESEQLVERLLSMESLVEASKFKRTEALSKIDWGAISLAKSDLAKLEIYFDATPNSKLQDLIAKAHREHKIKPFDLIIVDYLQLLNVDGARENRQNEVSRISRELKALARALKIPVIALAQLSREVEKRTDKRPILSDLRESGAIEQDADKVIFLYRHDYYAKKETDEQESTMSAVEVRVAKNRSGAIGQVVLNFNLVISKFQGSGGI